MCVRVDGHTYPTTTHLNYTLFPPGGVCAVDLTLECAVHDLDLESRAGLAFGNTAVLKMSETVPLSAARLGELALEPDSRRGAHHRARVAPKPASPVPAPRCAAILHRFDGTGTAS